MSIFFYTTEGQTIAPYENIEVENCQVIGRANGVTKKEALSNLLKENPWIIHAGFVPSELIVKQLLTDKLRDDIKTLLECLWNDEEKHYEESEDKSSHIFGIMKKLKSAIVAS